MLEQHFSLNLMRSPYLNYLHSESDKKVLSTLIPLGKIFQMLLLVTSQEVELLLVNTVHSQAKFFSKLKLAFCFLLI